MLLLWFCALSLQMSRGSSCFVGESRRAPCILYSQLHLDENGERLDVTPSNVDRIFKLPLREPTVAYFFKDHIFGIESIDLEYQPIGRCTEHANRPISCWTQVMEAAFVVTLVVRSPFLNHSPLCHAVVLVQNGRLLKISLCFGSSQMCLN